jgi:glucose-6-phosphate dehydrogenase assembly protein OpcA
LIVDMPKTTSSKIGKRLNELRETGGVVALGRVLSLIIETDANGIESAIEAANGASRLHPSRIIVLTSLEGDGESRLDAEIRVGGDAGASEVVILRAYGSASSNPESLITGLLLPDAPVVAWWPGSCAPNPAKSAIGRIASRRITDSSCQMDPSKFLKDLAQNYTPGDGDMAWTRITLWRSQLAALFEQHAHRSVTNIEVLGSSRSPSAELLARWLELRLQAPSKVTNELEGTEIEGIAGVKIKFEDGELEILRHDEIATITQTGFPNSSVLLPKRSDQDCLIEDMRFLGEDEIYGEVLSGRLAS